MKKISKSIVTLSLVGCAVLISTSAMADDSGWYVGGNVGKSMTKIDDAQTTSSLLGAGFTTVSIVDKNRDTGYKLFGGYQFNKNFSLEGGYFNLGKFGFVSTTAMPSAGTLSGNIRLQGLNLDAVGILPITEKFSVFGRLGINYAEAQDSFSKTGLAPVPTNLNPSKREVNPKAGIGVQYDFTKSLGMRVEAERYRINDAIGNRGDINLVSLGLVYNFGVKQPAPEIAPKAAESEPAPKAAVSEPVVADIAPAPIVVTPPPPPPPRKAPAKVVFASDSTVDSLFDFNKSEVKPSGKQAIDKFIADLSGASYDVITVTGHTDRIGSEAYNMKLSERRAEAVKVYMVESTGIPSDKITAKGMGKSEPVTKPGECNGNKSKKLIACLASDRRVEVEVTATREAKKVAVSL